MKDFILHLIDRGDWLTLAAIGLVILGLLVIVGMAALILITTLRDVLDVVIENRRTERLAAEHRAYQRGRRDERAELGAPDETHDCHSPLIIETLGDGTQRRLDR